MNSMTKIQWNYLNVIFSKGFLCKGEKDSFDAFTSNFFLIAIYLRDHLQADISYVQSYSV